MASGTAAGASPGQTAAPAKRDRTHWLYISVIVAVFLGIIVGFVFPDFAVGLNGWAPHSSG
jgi:aerobic C4-dicarboxylate transport protein